MNERTADGEPLEDKGIAGTAEKTADRDRPGQENDDQSEPNAAP